jgi:hypothetical protein
LLLDPTYGEYAHILDMIKCHVTKFALNETYDIDIQALRAASVGCDLVVLVNPNSPTGRWADLMAVLPHIACTVWVDETYIEFAGDVSVETYAASSTNVIVCKSMSKVYALSGIRVAYACGSPIHFAAIKARTPPWNVSRLAQSAGIAALSNDSMSYYTARIKESHQFSGPGRAAGVGDHPARRAGRRPRARAAAPARGRVQPPERARHARAAGARVRAARRGRARGRGRRARARGQFRYFATVR